MNLALSELERVGGGPDPERDDGDAVRVQGAVAPWRGAAARPALRWYALRPR